jgi:quercetin dioxygenase-like cupin family protein
MRYANLIGKLFLFGALVASGVSSSAQADDGGFVRLTPAELKWVPLSNGHGVESAILYGDPKKAGEFYVIQVKFPPYVFDYPHYHPENRHVTVIKGTWYTGTGDTLDIDKAVPLKAGSYMFHPAKAVHWDGAKDEEVIVEIAGIGPAPSILVKSGGDHFFSIKK